MARIKDSKNADAKRSLGKVLVILIVLIDLSETGGVDSTLKTRTSRTARRDASDDIGSVVGFIIVGERSRVEGSSVFVFQDLSDTKRSGEVFERSIWSSD